MLALVKPFVKWHQRGRGFNLRDHVSGLTWVVKTNSIEVVMWRSFFTCVYSQSCETGSSDCWTQSMQLCSKKKHKTKSNKKKNRQKPWILNCYKHEWCFLFQKGRHLNKMVFPESSHYDHFVVYIISTTRYKSGILL